jgi:FkbM family methyltransferase
VRRLGPRRYLRDAGLEYRQRLSRSVRAGEPFDIGATQPIVLHETTLPGVRSHWMASGQGIRELRAFKRIAPGHSTFLDVGAGSGLFAAAFCALTGGRAWAFEPSPIKFAELQALAAVNPSFDIAASQLALGASNGTCGARRDGKLFRGVLRAPDGSDATDTMQVETLDGFVERLRITPTMAKVDVDGMELAVLRGGERTFREHVRALALEVHATWLPAGESVEDVERAVCAAGFRIVTTEFKPIRSLARFVEIERGMHPGVVNVVCLN